MKVTPEKGQFLIAALDTYVKTKGISVAGGADILLREIQHELSQPPSVETVPPKEKKEPKSPTGETRRRARSR